MSPEGPAEKAGVKVGDVVVSVNGRTMRNARQLEALIYRSPMKEKITLQVLRGQNQLSMDVSVIDSVDDPQRFADMVNPEDNLVSKLGILGIGIDKDLAALLPGLRNSYGVRGSRGVQRHRPHQWNRTAARRRHLFREPCSGLVRGGVAEKGK